jgi:crotonobetainyl-CoA:carnitine CoA-transferase CaiB-like acyl-CoA transferase
VLKVEEPYTGDGTRSWGPPWAGDQSAYFLAANRSKQSLCINFRQPDGSALIRDLAARSDVLIENFKPGALQRAGLDYPALSAVNPRLIYCSITGYGQTGPDRDLPGYDFVVQAQSGLMSITGPVEGPPSKVGVALVDILTGMHAASAILAALLERERSGRGQYIDIALLDAALSSLANVAQNALVTGAVPGRYGSAHPSIVPYQPFATADGTLALAIGTDDQYARFCAAVERPDLAAEPYASNPGRVAQRAQLVPLLQEILQTRTTDAWLNLLHAINVPAGPVLDVAAALQQPQVAVRGLVHSVDHPSAGTVSLLGAVAHFSRTSAAEPQSPPTLGQHTRTALTRVLGLDDATLDDLQRRKIIA